MLQSAKKGKRKKDRRSCMMVSTSVPVNCQIVLNMVNHLNDHSVTFPCSYLWPWKLPIHRHDALGLAKSCHILHSNLRRILHMCSRRSRSIGKRKNSDKANKEKGYIKMGCSTYVKLIVPSNALMLCKCRISKNPERNQHY